MAVLEHEFVVTPGDDVLEQEALRRLLEQPEHTARLVGADGTELQVPQKVYEILVWVAHQMSHGRAISLIPREQQLTTQQAANFLNVSRPYLIKLLDRGEMGYTKTGTHRRVKLEDVLAYKERHDREMKERIDEMGREEAALGL